MGVGASRGVNTGDEPTSGFEPLLEGSHAGTRTPRSYATIPAASPEAASSTLPLRDIHPFWVPPLEVDPRKHYYLINAPKSDKPNFNRSAARPFVLYDLLLSAIFITIAIGLIRPTFEHQQWQAIVGAVLFQAGIVAAVMAIYSLFRGCCRRFFRVQDFLIVLVIGISIYMTGTSEDPWTLPAMSKLGTWQRFVGLCLLEAVAIFVLSRGCFLLQTIDDTVDMLMVDVASLQMSVAVGLTEAYFDRVREVGDLIKQAPSTTIRVSYQNPVESRGDEALLSDDMVVPCLFIAVPRYIDWRDQSPTLARKQNYVRLGRLLSCHVLGSDSSKDPWLCVTGIRQGHVLDVSPAPLQTIINDIRRNPSFSNDEERTSHYQKEAHRFSQRLAWLLLSAGLESFVKILEFQDDIMTYFPSACTEVIAGIQRANGAAGADEQEP